MSADTLEPGDWKPPPPIDYTKVSTQDLALMIREINDRLVQKGAPRPLISPTVPGMKELDEEAKDLHSRYFAIKHALYMRGIKDKT